MRRWSPAIVDVVRSAFTYDVYAMCFTPARDGGVDGRLVELGPITPAAVDADQQHARAAPIRVVERFRLGEIAEPHARAARRVRLSDVFGVRLTRIRFSARPCALAAPR